MNNSDKQIIEKIVKDTIHQNKIPGEDDLRKIVKEEIEGYFLEKEKKKNEKLSKKFNEWVKMVIKNFYCGMFWYSF